MMSELDAIGDVSNALRCVEIALGFLTSTGGDPHVFYKQYISTILHMNIETFIASRKVTFLYVRVCMLHARMCTCHLVCISMYVASYLCACKYKHFNYKAMYVSVFYVSVFYVSVFYFSVFYFSVFYFRWCHKLFSISLLEMFTRSVMAIPGDVIEMFTRGGMTIPGDVIEMFTRSVMTIPGDVIEMFTRSVMTIPGDVIEGRREVTNISPDGIH